MDVSVIVTVYNKSEYLKDCLDSLVNQNMDNIEIIVIDDGSTDESSRIIRQYSAKYPGIKAITQENRGLAEARITGFLKATGKYIGFVDADDYVKTNMFKTLFDLAESEKADLVYCDYECFPKNSIVKAKWFSEYEGIKDWKYLDKNTQFWNKLFKRDILQRVDLPELLKKYGEYSPILPMLKAEKIVFTREVLYFYRVGHTTMSGGSFEGKVRHYIEGTQISAILPNMIKGTEYETALREYFQYRYIYTLLLLCIVSAKNKEKKVYMDAKRKLYEIEFNKNQYVDIIPSIHYGKKKAYVITHVIPHSYILACVITSIVL